MNESYIGQWDLPGGHLIKREQIEDYDISDKFKRAINKAYDMKWEAD